MISIRGDKDILEKYIDEFKYCYAGLCLSNGMTEIVCRDFDKRLKAKLTVYGVFFYERYVDDMLIMLNNYISQDEIIDIINKTINETFDICPVKLSTAITPFVNQSNEVPISCLAITTREENIFIRCLSNSSFWFTAYCANARSIILECIT